MHPTKHASCLLLAFFFLVLSPTGLQADIYSWTDENGVRRYSNATIPDTRAGSVKTFQSVPGPTPQRKHPAQNPRW